MLLLFLRQGLMLHPALNYEASLELMILLPLHPKYWDYRHVSPCLAGHAAFKEQYMDAKRLGS